MPRHGPYCKACVGKKTGANYGLKGSGRREWCGRCAKKQRGETERIGSHGNQLCESCPKHANFGLVGEGKRRWCGPCAEKQRGATERICGSSGTNCETCPKQAHFGLVGEGKRRWCGPCAEKQRGATENVAYLAEIAKGQRAVPAKKGQRGQKRRRPEPEPEPESDEWEAEQYEGGQAAAAATPRGASRRRQRIDYREQPEQEEPPEPAPEPPEQQYEIEITGERQSDGVTEYRVSWVGFPSSEDQWLLKGNINKEALRVWRLRQTPEDQLECVCKQPRSPAMSQRCSVCDGRFHRRCVGLPPSAALAAAFGADSLWICPLCADAAAAGGVAEHRAGECADCVPGSGMLAGHGPLSVANRGAAQAAYCGAHLRVQRRLPRPESWWPQELAAAQAELQHLKHEAGLLRVPAERSIRDGRAPAFVMGELAAIKQAGLPSLPDGPELPKDRRTRRAAARPMDSLVAQALQAAQSPTGGNDGAAAVWLLAKGDEALARTYVQLAGGGASGGAAEPHRTVTRCVKRGGPARGAQYVTVKDEAPELAAVKQDTREFLGAVGRAYIAAESSRV